MKKKYTIQGLADILGCSRVAISKKITKVNDATGTKLFKKRYEVVTDNRVMHILLDDTELEQEKRLSKGFNNVSSNSYETVENNDIIDIEPIETKKTQDKLFEFTERYINDYKTLIATHYEELRNRDNQILLLTTSEKQKENEYNQVKAEVKTLKARNRIVTLWLIVLATLLVVVVTSFVTFAIFHQNVNETKEKETPKIETVAPKIVQPTPTEAKAPVKAVKKR